MKMSELNIGMKLEDGRTGEVFTVVEKNSKYKTVILEGEAGKTHSTCLSTITKHFAEVVDLDDLSTPEEPVAVETEPVVKEPVAEEPVSVPVTEEPVVEVEEFDEVEKKKPKKRKKLYPRCLV